MSDTQWFYVNRGDRKGPVSTETIRALIEAGAVEPDAIVWREGMAEWEPAYRHIAGVVPPVPGQRGGVGSRPAGRAAPAGSSGGYGEWVSFGQAFGLFFSNYANFSDRSTRSAYWWWFLWSIIIGVATLTLDILFIDANAVVTPINWIWSLATLLPSLAIGVRRLHDINRSGWWLLIALTGIGVILLIVWFCKESDRGPNHYG